MFAKKLLTKRKFWFILLLAVVDYLFFSLTNPASVASFLLIVGFVLLMVTFYVVVALCLTGLSFYSAGLKRQRRRLALALTVVAGILLALQSMGQLAVRDALVIIPLGIVLYVYLTFIKVRPARAR